jgi:hypothetical protein
MDAEEARQVFSEVVAFAAFPVLVVIGLLTAAAVTVRGDWKDGVGLGLEFWVAAGLLKLSVATTWMAIASAIIIITVRRAVMWAIGRASAARAEPAP